MENQEVIRDLFRSIRGWNSHDFVLYVLDNDNQAPEYIKNLCYQYLEEWGVDAKELTLNKPSERTYSIIASYYGL